MTDISKMYGNNTKVDEEVESSDNVTVRNEYGQYVSILSEGVSHKVPTLANITKLEETLNRQKVMIEVLSRKISRQESAIQTLEGILRSRK
jgi:hypothetical protein